MRQSESWKTWVIVFVLLIFAGLASAIVPLIADELSAGSESETETRDAMAPITLDVENMLLGDELMNITFISEKIHGQTLEVWQALAIISGIVMISVGSLGLALTGITMILSRQVEAVYTNEDFQEAQSELDKRQQAALKEWRQAQPAVERDEPEARARVSAYVFSIIILLFVWIAGLTLGASTLADVTWQFGNVSVPVSTLINIVLVLVTLLVLILAARRQGAAELFSGKSESAPVNWGIIWVIISGLLIVGVGTGAAIALISG